MAAGGVHDVELPDTGKPAGQLVAPGASLPTQFLLDLPKRGREDAAARLVVTLDFGGEQLRFEFREGDGPG